MNSAQHPSAVLTMAFRWEKNEAWRNHPMLTNQLRVARERPCPFFPGHRHDLVIFIKSAFLPHLHANLRPYLAVPGLKWGAAAFAVYVVYDMLANGGKKEKHH